MHREIKFQNLVIVRPPIYMALLVKNGPLIRHLLWTYRNNFLSNEKSKMMTFYDVAKSRMYAEEIIEYLVNVFDLQSFYPTKNPKNFPSKKLSTAMEDHQELQNLLKFFLEYITANNPAKESFEGLYNFLYFSYLWLRRSKMNRSEVEIIKNVTDNKKFQYGIHSYLIPNYTGDGRCFAAGISINCHRQIANSIELSSAKRQKLT